MTKPAANAPLSELLTGLVSDVTGLVRKEIELAKTEASEQFDKALGGIETLLFGVILAIVALGVLLSAVVSGLAAVFVQSGMTEPSANALSGAIVGVIFAAAGWMLISSGLKALRARNLRMDRTLSSVRRDVGVVKEKI